MLDEHAAYFIGQAVASYQTAQRPPERGTRRQTTPQEAQERAGRFLGRAFQLYMQGGLTKEQAAQKILALTQMFASLE